MANLKSSYDDNFEEDELTESEAESLEYDYMLRRLNLTYNILFWATLTEFELNLSEAMVMTLISDLSEKDGHCRASKQRLADLLSVTRPTIHKCLRNLREKRLIRMGPKVGNGVGLIKPARKWSALIKAIRVKYRDIKLAKKNRFSKK